MIKTIVSHQLEQSPVSPKSELARLKCRKNWKNNGKRQRNIEQPIISQNTSVQRGHHTV